jgi:hypothetical protein
MTEFERGGHQPPRPRLGVEQILDWADAHHAATGEWPTVFSGAVHDTPSERWSAINTALRVGLRGLPGGSSLPRLLNEHRPARRRALSLETIRVWGEAHRAATGRRPHIASGAVAGAPGEKWSRIHWALREGRRGLPGGMSLKQLFGGPIRTPEAGSGSESESGSQSEVVAGPRLTIRRILAWGDAHRAASGAWPVRGSGAVAEAPGETWDGVDTALRRGLRGLPGAMSLRTLFVAHRAASGVVPAGVEREARLAK